ncbi:MAG: GGDEF domain-containing protein [Campylobacterota bacterium]|nr:GGDEF domain-containing protein [Campylobacterota bacterium]
MQLTEDENINRQFIVFIFTVSFIYFTILLTTQIPSMKRNSDMLYSNALIPISELNKADQIYHLKLKNTLALFQSSEITSTQAILEMDNSLLSLEKIWQNYKNNFSYDEINYLEYALSEIYQLNKKYKAIQKKIETNKQIEPLSLTDLKKDSANIDLIIQKLISDELEIAKNKREKFIDSFNLFRTKIIIVLSVLVFSTLLYFSVKYKLLFHLSRKKVLLTNTKPKEVEYKDSLTSLYTRRYFNLIFNKKLENAKKNKEYIALIMIDIDYFKEYNNCYGYTQGDKTLLLMAEILKKLTNKKNDFIFRFNGEAFVILSTKTNEMKSLALTNKILQSVKEKQIDHNRSDIDTVLTVSVGMAYCKASAKTTQYSLISQADKMLVKAKENGRNRSAITKGK